MDAAAAGQAEAMALQLGLGELLARVLAGRGVRQENAIATLAPKLRDLMPDPHVLRDMAAGAARLADAIERRETIAIFGDYDVDGAASAALLAEYAGGAGCPFRLHIPDRIFEGYGPNIEAISMLAGAGATLLVTVDCGTTSIAAMSHAKAIGLDRIVLDHHQAPVELPDALVVNPNRQDDVSGLGHLCAAGVVHLTLVALHRELRKRGFWTPDNPGPNLMESVDLVALATVADVAPLVGLNRAYVWRGLEVMRARGRPGLRALFDVAGADGPPKAYHLGFLIGPRINAGGRIGDAGLGARLLLERDDAEAQRIAAELDRLNRERRQIEGDTLELAHAEALASLGAADQDAVILTQGQGWHPGVVGLVASRLREAFGRPAFAIAFNGATGTGSGRSILGVDLGRAVREAVEAGILAKGGGHAMAAGVTVAREKLGELRDFLETRLAAPVARARADEALLIDAAMTAAGAHPALIDALEQAGPFGAGNPEPIFAFPAHRIVQATPMGQGHVKVKATAPDRASIEAIAFRCADGPLGQTLLAAAGESLHLAGSLSLDAWGGRQRVQLRLVDCAKA